MNTQDIRDYFDRLAPTWDAEMVRSDEKINTILDCGGIHAGVNVLDVACGTGVLFPDYLRRSVSGVTGVDISPEMVKIASAKFNDPRISVLCADVQELEFVESFDCVMIYNAFPHFPNPEKLLEHLAICLVPGGRLTVAHGMSRAKIDAHHHGSARNVSMGLMPETELSSLMELWFDVDTVVSDDEKYIVSGIVKQGIL